MFLGTVLFAVTLCGISGVKCSSKEFLPAEPNYHHLPCGTSSYEETEEETTCTVEDFERVTGIKILNSASNVATTPWLVSLQDTRYPESIHYCGGAIITATWVLTSAYCVHTYKPQEIQVVAGETNMLLNEFWEQTRDVAQIQVHPHYDDFRRNNDLALIKLDPPFQLNEKIQAGKIAKNQSDNYENCATSGWGLMGGIDFHTPFRHAQRLNIVPQITCDTFYPNLITTEMICAMPNNTEGYGSLTMGDWGGALSCRISADDHEEEEELVAIASWGILRKNFTSPTVFTNVSLFYAWIRDTIHESFDNTLTSLPIL